jgi:selenocysteine-specific elongation factor
VALDHVGPGRRVAVNLVGVGSGDVRRGQALVHPGAWHPTRVVDASLTVLAALDHDVSRRGAHVAHFGTGEHPVRLRVLGPDAIAAGRDGPRAPPPPRAAPARHGDRYVLRESGRGETVGGGEVLDVAPCSRRPGRTRRHDGRIVAERGWVDADDLARMTGSTSPASLGRWVVDADALAATTTGLAAAVDAAGPLGLDVAALDERQRAVLAAAPAGDEALRALADVVVVGGRARREAAPDTLASHPWLAALEAAPFAPPPPADVGREELRELVRRGLVVAADGTWFAAGAVQAAGRAVAQLLASRPEGVTVAEVRDALGTSRKFLLPLLAVLDGTGVTRRRGDVRLPGPRLPGP